MGNDGSKALHDDTANTTSTPVVNKIFALVVGAVVLYLVHRLRSVLFPFALGGLVAYALAPVTRILHRRGLSWKLSSAVVFCTTILAGIILLFLVVPQVIHQSQDLVEELPEYTGEFLTLIERVNNRVFPHVNFSLPLRGFLEELRSNLPDYVTRVLGWMAEFVYLMVRIAFIGLIVTPFILYYVLVDATKIRSTLIGLIPRERRKKYIVLIREIDRIVGGFIRGRILVSLFVGVCSVVGLYIIGIEFPLVIGVLAGILNIVPYVGSVVGAIPALVFALARSPIHVVAVLLLFGGINLVEGVYVMPRLVGKEMNLHPMTILFAFLVGEALYGPFGLIVSIPVAGVLKVLLTQAGKRSPATQAHTDEVEADLERS